MSTQTVPMPEPDDAEGSAEWAGGGGRRAPGPVSPLGLDALAEQLVAQARDEGISLTGPGGLLSGFTSRVLQTALEAELTEHLGHEPHADARVIIEMTERLVFCGSDRNAFSRPTFSS